MTNRNMTNCKECSRVLRRVQSEIRLHLAGEYKPRKSKISMSSDGGAIFEFDGYVFHLKACCPARARYQGWNRWLNIYLGNDLGAIG